MAKKHTKKTAKKSKGWLTPKNQINRWLKQTTQHILQGDYPAVIQTCQRILRYVPPTAPERAEALEHLATAYTMNRQFEEAYQTLSQLLALTPQYAHLWYNRGMTGRYTLRLVQAIYDLEKAVELETNPAQRAKFSEILAETRIMAESERALRGPGFTLEQL
jgi:tetratricopeptide (TPR) repeat protein